MGTATTKPARQTPLPDSALPPAAQELRRQLHEWNESFGNPAQRAAYIRAVCRRIAETYHPEKIILFGSHAYGTPTPESDIDLLVVLKEAEHPVEQSIKMTLELGIYTPLDLLIRTLSEVKNRLADGDMFMRLIWERGKVMYEATQG